jgi:hypothetical protein
MDEENAWIRRVLGVQIRTDAGTAGAFDAKAWRAARESWNDAMDQVNKQISDLQKALRDSGDEDYVRISEFGLNGVTNNQRVPLMAALAQLGDGSSPPSDSAARTAATRLRSFRDFLENDEVIEAMDHNPLMVPVRIQSTLDPALAQLEEALGI